MAAVNGWECWGRWVALKAYWGTAAELFVNKLKYRAAS